MKRTLNKEILCKISSIKISLFHKARTLFALLRHGYQKLNRRQCVTLGMVAGIAVLLLLVMGVRLDSESDQKTALQNVTGTQMEKYPIKEHEKNIDLKRIPAIKPEAIQWEEALNQLNIKLHTQYTAIENQLQTIVSTLSSLASAQAVQQLTQTMGAATPELLGKINALQASVQKMLKQTKQSAQANKIIWVNPERVTPYFRLVAIQGFSDGMRAIVDVEGHQTALSVHERCPACRGWILERMNFSDQRAVFSKEEADQKLYVTLQVN